MKIGKIAKLLSFVSAFDETGERYELSPGDLFLVLDHNFYDTVILSSGSVLFCFYKKVWGL